MMTLMPKLRLCSENRLRIVSDGSYSLVLSEQKISAALTNVLFTVHSISEKKSQDTREKCILGFHPLSRVQPK